MNMVGAEKTQLSVQENTRTKQYPSMNNLQAEMFKYRKWLLSVQKNIKIGKKLQL